MNGDSGSRGAGGTSGGIGEFVIGLSMAAAGGWMVTNQVVVHSGYWRLWGYNAFGITLLPLIVGIGFLFFNGRSLAGRLLTVVGLVIIFIGIITHLDIYFQPTSLFNTLFMLGLLAGGIGLIVKSLRAH
ncbi:MAG: hypothetical protein EBZ36_05270 [Acidobacteria bacterium]|nr:hypothetical protein [Acidobacteriota bacterium]